MSVFPVKKFFAIFSLLTLTLMSAPPPLRSETTAADPGPSLPLSDLAVPEEIGKVQERFEGSPAIQTGNNLRTIIQIQDVHANATAQQNIAAILERLRVVFGVETAAIEGAWATTSLPKSHALPTSREKQLLAGTLLDDDRISGPVYAAIMSPEPITLVGIEDETSYEKNRALFLAHLGGKKEAAEKLRTYGASLQDSQRALWGPELLAFGNSFGKFRETSDLGKFLPLLLQNAEAQNAGTSDLAQITLMRDILTLEKSLPKERLEQAVRNLMREYKNTPWTLEELIRGSKIPTQKLNAYPEIKNLVRLYQMRDQISLQELTAEIQTLTKRILGTLVKTPEERALWEKTERFYLARRALLLQASPEDIKILGREKSLFESELAGASLSASLALSLDFYKVVQKRDEIFFEKIMTDPTLAGNIAVVTGGFHTDGLSQRFRDAGISYVTIAPELGDAPMNEKIYAARMKDAGYRMAENTKPDSLHHSSPNIQGKAQSATLSELRNAIAWIDDKFRESYEVLLQTRDVRRAKTAFLGEPVAVSKGDRISHLSRGGRILPKSKIGNALSASGLRVSEFMAKPRLEQLESVRVWLQSPEQQEKVMLVSSVQVLTKMLSQENVAKLLRGAVEGGDILALAQDIPATEMPEILLSTRGIERFEVPDIAALLEKTPRFQRFAKKHPFVIMKENYQGGVYVVLPEKPLSLVLFRIITLNPNLYQASKDPAFLALLQDLVAEILSQELPGKAA